MRFFICCKRGVGASTPERATPARSGDPGACGGVPATVAICRGLPVCPVCSVGSPGGVPCAAAKVQSNTTTTLILHSKRIPQSREKEDENYLTQLELGGAKRVAGLSVNSSSVFLSLRSKPLTSFS